MWIDRRLQLAEQHERPGKIQPASGMVCQVLFKVQLAIDDGAVVLRRRHQRHRLATEQEVPRILGMQLDWLSCDRKSRRNAGERQYSGDQRTFHCQSSKARPESE